MRHYRFDNGAIPSWVIPVAVAAWATFVVVMNAI